MIVNPNTGEVLDLEEMGDEEVVQLLGELEEQYKALKQIIDAAKNRLLFRMMDEGATLRLLDRAKVRIHSHTKIRDKKLVERLAEECPADLKDKCFSYDIRPLKRGLNELSKLGAEWKQKVEAIYEEQPRLVIDWQEPDEEGGQGGKDSGECPF